MIGEQSVKQRIELLKARISNHEFEGKGYEGVYGSLALGDHERNNNIVIQIEDDSVPMIVLIILAIAGCLVGIVIAIIKLKHKEE